MSKTPDQEDPVTVLETGDSALLPVLKSALSAAGIPFVVQGDEAQGLFPLGAGGGISSFSKGMMARIQVPASYADEARALIQDGSQPVQDDSQAADEEE